MEAEGNIHLMVASFKLFQTGAKRLDQALAGIPDKVPVYAQMHEFVMHELGVPATEFYTRPEIIVPGTLEITQKYGIDVALLDYDAYNIEAEALGQKIIFKEDQMPDVDRNTPLITSPADLSKIRTPDFETAGRFATILQMHRLFADYTGAPPPLQFTAPFSLAANIRGIEQLILDIYTNPSFARGLFDALVEEVLAPWINYMKAHFPEVHAIGGSDATASLPIVNLKILKEWIIPYILKLRDICEPEVYVPNWVGERYLKDPQEMLALKLQVCPHMLEGQDPDVAELGPEIYKAYAQSANVPLVLGVGAGFLATSKPDAVFTRVQNYVKTGGAGGRFALYLCNLGSTTPPENVRAAIEAVQIHGIYS